MLVRILFNGWPATVTWPVCWGSRAHCGQNCARTATANNKMQPPTANVVVRSVRADMAPPNSADWARSGKSVTGGSAQNGTRRFRKESRIAGVDRVQRVGGRG